MWTGTEILPAAGIGVGLSIRTPKSPPGSISSALQEARRADAAPARIRARLEPDAETDAIGPPEHEAERAGLEPRRGHVPIHAAREVADVGEHVQPDAGRHVHVRAQPRAERRAEAVRRVLAFRRLTDVRDAGRRTGAERGG